jgi:hypothetical protein
LGELLGLNLHCLRPMTIAQTVSRNLEEFSLTTGFGKSADHAYRLNGSHSTERT